MYEINTVYKMNGGGGCYDRLQNIICTIALFLLLVINIFAEVPHTTIVENPSKEVTKVETLKRRDKAELNITVEKKKSKEVIGYVDGNKVIISKEKNPQVNFEDSYEVIDNLDGKISKGYTITTTEEGIEVEGSKVPNFLYLVGKIGAWRWNNKNNNKELLLETRANENIITFDETYNGEKFNFTQAGNVIPSGMKFESIGHRFYKLERTSSIDNFDSGYAVYYFNINNNVLIENRSFDYKEVTCSYPNTIVEISPEITLKITGNGDYCYFEFLKFPKKEFSLNINIEYALFRNGNAPDPPALRETESYNINLIFKYKPNTLIGESTLTVREKYPTNQYIQFNSTAFEDRKPLALENSLTDVTFNTTGKGIVTMVEGDILEIDGKQVTIGAGGNLGVQEATIGDLKYSYKVEAGKLRLALNEWGILEPNHDLMIRVFRTENGNQRKMVEHTLTIDSPRRVEGTNNIKIDNNYQIRNVIKFNGISLDTPSSFSLESPIPTGVTLAEQTGYGIPLLDEGDTIQVDDGRTRTVHSYTIQSGGTLASQRIEFSNGSIDLQVVNRKVQVRLNNWKVNEPMRLNLRAIRGVNEISNHAITLTAPEAPFNMLETGNLDFGNVLQGAKNKKAESNIRIEMLAGQDVSEVKFNLREEQPVMTNSQGTELKVKSIDKTVQKVRDREYNIKLRGTLDVPEEQQNGEYRGSNILDIEVK